jgi:hypothetical protein
VVRIVFLILGLVVGICAGLLGTVPRAGRARRTFRRTLRRYGLSAEVADELTERYREGLSLRGLVRMSKAR